MEGGAETIRFDRISLVAWIFLHLNISQFVSLNSNELTQKTLGCGCSTYVLSVTLLCAEGLNSTDGKVYKSTV